MRSAARPGRHGEVDGPRAGLGQQRAIVGVGGDVELPAGLLGNGGSRSARPTSWTASLAARAWSVRPPKPPTPMTATGKRSVDISMPHVRAGRPRRRRPPWIQPAPSATCLGAAAPRPARERIRRGAPVEPAAARRANLAAVADRRATTQRSRSSGAQPAAFAEDNAAAAANVSTRRPDCPAGKDFRRPLDTAHSGNLSSLG